MRVTIIGEYGYLQALLGLGLSYGITSEKSLEDLSSDVELLNKLQAVGPKLILRGEEHCKFLESMIVYIDLSAPRYFHQQLDTYRVGITKQSGSTMHTILRHPLAQKDFVHFVLPQTLSRLNELVESRSFEQLKAELPEGFLQRRILCTNYRTLSRIIKQRYNHRLAEWQLFIQSVRDGVRYPDFLGYPEAEDIDDS